MAVAGLIALVSWWWVVVSNVIGLWKARQMKRHVQHPTNSSGADGGRQMGKVREDVRRRATRGLIIIAATSLLSILLLAWFVPSEYLGWLVVQGSWRFLGLCIQVPPWLLIGFLLVVRYLYRRPRQSPVVVADPTA